MLINIKVHKTINSFLNKRNERYATSKIFRLQFEPINAS